MSRRALRSRRVVTERVEPATIVLDGESIAAIEPFDADLGDVSVEDHGDLVMMAGLVDAHVHVNEPGRTDWEGYVTATRAAAAGGVTTVVDMPLNCIPVTTRRAALEEKLASADGELWVDVGFWGGVVPDNQGDLEALCGAGVLGCKAFMIDSGIPEFGWSDRSVLAAAMPILKAAGLPLLAHAELDLGAEITEPDPRAYRGYLQSRPKAWEDAAIALLIELCRETGCAVHVVHLSSADSLPQLRAARDEGLPITVETCAHYLCLAAEEVPDGDTTFKCAPPIREADNRERLWQGLADGIIDFVVTDHSPCTPGLKGLEEGDFHAAWGGIASLQLGLFTVWGEAQRRGFDLPQLSRWMSAEPARFVGRPEKGRIAVGADADLVIWDPDAKTTIAAEHLEFRHKVSPYVGREGRGRVARTMLRGHTVFDGADHAAAPRGRPLLGRVAPRRGSSR